MKRTSSAAARPAVLCGLFLLTLASCRRSVSDHATGPGGMPGITAAPAVAGPIETSDVPPEPAPEDDDPPAADSADAMAAAASESANRGAGSPDATPTAAASTSEEAESPSGTKPDASAEYPLQDNPLAGCSICHVDIEDEFIGSLHFEEKVGCITCHGPSEGHLADENNEVKPDEVFARPDVNRLCERCHECSRPKPRKPELTPAGQRKVCVDCHGAHDVVLADNGIPAKSP